MNRANDFFVIAMAVVTGLVSLRVEAKILAHSDLDHSPAAVRLSLPDPLSGWMTGDQLEPITAFRNCAWRGQSADATDPADLLGIALNRSLFTPRGDARVFYLDSANDTERPWGVARFQALGDPIPAGVELRPPGVPSVPMRDEAVTGALACESSVTNPRHLRLVSSSPPDWGCTARNPVSASLVPETGEFALVASFGLMGLGLNRFVRRH